MVALESPDTVRARISALPDPEIPVLSLGDLGIVREILVDGDSVRVGVTPTYSACPATEAIENAIRLALEEAGFADIVIDRLLSPPWTTDWISESGKRKLEAFGIAPPSGPRGRYPDDDRPLACPRCGAVAATRVSEFGSTPCKASYKCDACLEPFEYFKCL